MDLLRFGLPSFVQFEIRVGLQSEYCIRLHVEVLLSKAFKNVQAEELWLHVELFVAW